MTDLRRAQSSHRPALEDGMYFHTPESLQAEIEYRQERLKRDFQRPGWFLRRAPKPEATALELRVIRSRHAM
ncbi:hypothetical protein [Kribbella caucasensis]|nr:hypothetical protein [Kribbella sp. VKM Ac-2527]